MNAPPIPSGAGQPSVGMPPPVPPQNAPPAVWTTTPPETGWYGGPRPYDFRAIVALVLGIVGVVACPLVLSIVAVVMGMQSQTRIKQSGGALDGFAVARVATILGFVGIGLWVVIGGLFGMDLIMYSGY